MVEIINGDMFVELLKLESNSIDLVLADLPYGQTNCKWDNKIDLNTLWIELKRVGKENTAYIFFCTTKFGYELIKANEKWFRYDLVWNKEIACGFLNARKMPMRSHEMIYVFYEKLPIYNIADNHIHNPTLTGNRVKNSSAVYGNQNELIHLQSSQYEPLLPKSVLNIKPTNKKRKGKHPTEKPVELYEWIIKYFTTEESKILDVCFGSGNSAIVARNLNRDYIGFELDETYYNNAMEHLTTT